MQPWFLLIKFKICHSPRLNELRAYRALNEFSLHTLLFMRNINFGGFGWPSLPASQSEAVHLFSSWYWVSVRVLVNCHTMWSEVISDSQHRSGSSLKRISFESRLAGKMRKEAHCLNLRRSPDCTKSVYATVNHRKRMFDFRFLLHACVVTIQFSCSQIV